VAGAKPLTDTVNAERILAILLEELPVKQAAALAGKLSDSNKNELYQKALAMRKITSGLSGDE